MKKLLLTLGSTVVTIAPLTTVVSCITAGPGEGSDGFYPEIDIQDTTLMIIDAVVPTDKTDITRFYESLTGTFESDIYNIATKIEINIEDDGTGKSHTKQTIDVSDLVHDGTGNTGYASLKLYLNETWIAVGDITAKARPVHKIFEMIINPSAE